MWNKVGSMIYIIPGPTTSLLLGADSVHLVEEVCILID